MFASKAIIIKIFTDDDNVNEGNWSSSSDESYDIADNKYLYASLALLSSDGLVVRGPLELRPRIEGYVENVIPRYSAEEFKSHFRMYPETFAFVLELIRKPLSTTPSISRRKPISPERQLLIALWIMATPDSYRSVCQRFNVGKATVVRTIRRVTYALHCLAPQFIIWPNGDSVVQTIQEFEDASAFPGTIGALDGTHIQIRAPKEDQQSYVNRKGVHSVHLQAVCNHRCLFTSCFAGNVGSVHDNRVFMTSPLSRYLENSGEYFPNNTHIIGDAAYGIQLHLLTPYRDNGHLTARQKNYNFCHSSARMAIERAFGLLKGRFRRLLDCLPLTDVHYMPEFILACCVLHNICLFKNDLVEPIPHINLQHNPVNHNHNRERGLAKRTQITNNLLMRI